MARVLPILRRTGSNLVRAARRGLSRSTLRAEGLWLSLRLAPPLGELPVLRFGREPAPGLLDVLETLDLAARDPAIEGVFVELAGAPDGWSRTLSMRAALRRVRAAGKPVAVYAESLDSASLLLASAADRIWLPETGRVFLVGVRADAFYLRDLLGRLDVAPEVVRIGTHKTAAEMLTRSGMSPEQREQLEGLIDDLYGALVDGIAAGRGLSADEVRARIDAGPYGATEAREAGLIDGCLYPDEIDDRLAELAPLPPSGRPSPRRATRLDARRYHAIASDDGVWRPVLAGGPRLAYVVAEGAIHRGDGPRGIGSEALSALLDELREERGVRGVLLRIDSPGGDALASELLWRSLSLLRREKPVVASMAEVAASGGYYLASAADAVFAEAGSVTGSIGVVGGKLDFGGLYKKLGVGRDAVERGARAGLLSEARGFTPDERKVLRDEMASLYAAFVDRVARGRGMAHAAVERVAQGRVYSGVRAVEAGLVDALGGPLEALEDLRARAGLSPGERVPLEVHPHRRLPGLASLLGGFG